MIRLFKIKFESDIFEINVDDYGKEILIINDDIMSNDGEFGLTDKYTLDSEKHGVLFLEYDLNVNQSLCEVSISNETTVLAKYRGTFDQRILTYLHKSAQQVMLKPKAKKKKVLKLLLSMILSFLIWNLFFSWQSALIIIGFIFIHEFGHFLAMGYFGYSHKNIMFAPPFGAVASGFKKHEIPKERYIIALAGPLPGIMIAYVIYILNIIWFHEDILNQMVLISIALNYFNLIPVHPLDGGRMFETMLLYEKHKAQKIISGIGIVLFIIIGLVTFNLVMLAISIFFGVLYVKDTKQQTIYQSQSYVYKKHEYMSAWLLFIGLWLTLIVFLLSFFA